MVVLFEANYKSPDNEAGHFEASFLNDSIQQQQQQHTESDDDQQKLLDIEQNIANLEKSYGKGEHYQMQNWWVSQLLLSFEMSNPTRRPVSNYVLMKFPNKQWDSNIRRFHSI